MTFNWKEILSAQLTPKSLPKESESPYWGNLTYQLDCESNIGGKREGANSLLR